MMKKTIQWTALAASTILATSTLALALTLPPTVGPYLEGDFGYGHVSTLKSHNGVTGGIGLGYKFTQHWAIDGGFTAFSKANVATHYFYGAVKGIYSLENGWNLFGKIGPAYVNGSRHVRDSSSDEMALYLGVGASLWLRSNTGIILQTVMTTEHSNVPATYALTVGINYFF
jgi:hypothetical protein